MEVPEREEPHDFANQFPVLSWSVLHKHLLSPLFPWFHNKKKPSLDRDRLERAWIL